MTLFRVMSTPHSVLKSVVPQMGTSIGSRTYLHKSSTDIIAYTMVRKAAKDTKTPSDDPMAIDSGSQRETERLAACVLTCYST